MNKIIPNDLSISSLHKHYEQGSLSVTDAMKTVLKKRETGIENKDNIWI